MKILIVAKICDIKLLSSLCSSSSSTSKDESITNTVRYTIQPTERQMLWQLHATLFRQYFALC